MTTTATYVTVMDATPRSGWIVAHRVGDLIIHKRLDAAKSDPVAARAEAEALFPDARVYLPGDPNPPWKDTK